MQHSDYSAQAVALKYSVHNKIATVRHQVARGNVSIINQTIAASPALFTAGAMNKYIFAVLNMIKAEPLWRGSPIPWCACVCTNIMMKALKPPPSTSNLTSKPTLVHRLCIITDNDWSSHISPIRAKHCQPSLAAQSREGH